MKKLMVAAAAALTATIGFSVESSNIVGYQQVEIPNVDFVLFTPTFTGVNSGLDLTTIKMIDAYGDDFDPFEMVTVQTMDETGAYTDIYTYSPTFYPTTGWAHEGVELEPGDVQVLPGRAFCVNNACGQAVYMLVSGKVDLENKNFIPNVDYVLWGNSTPVAIDLTSISLVDVDGTEIDPFEMITIQTMDETGAYTDLYTYCPTFYTYGWALNGVELAPGDFVIQPGQSFCVNNAYGNVCYVKLPNPTTYTLPVAD